MSRQPQPCPDCQSPGLPGAKFCEDCGGQLPGGCPCGGTVADDGYCTICGAKSVPARDHVVEDFAPWLGAISDRGIRHHRNEDAFAMALTADRAVLVVCDGVSSSTEPDVASLAAAEAARNVLVTDDSGSAAAPASGQLSPVDPHDRSAQLMIAAVTAANYAVVTATLASTDPGQAKSPGSCTFVAAIVTRTRIVVGCVGDSRAYWVPEAGPATALTVDDSWAAERIALGVPREQAETGPGAHAITRWLGLDAPDHTPSLTQFSPDGPGWLVVCSDGLWNYCSSEADFGSVIREHCATKGTITAAAQLVDWAKAQGGHDNITVALARLDQDSSRLGTP